jgi:hypothetical protein
MDAMGTSQTGRLAGASSETDEPQADAFEEGAHPCSMGLWVLRMTELHLPRNVLI